jgi:hypothetical protein
MNTLNRDYDDVLRRALHAAAESVEPSPDGLERIRARMKTPPVLSFASVVAWCQEAATIVVGWAAPLIRTALDAFWSVIDRFRPASALPSESGSRSAWIRPMVAMGTAIFVVAAGAFAVLTLPHAISPNNGSAFFSLPWSHSTSSGSSGGGNSNAGGLSGNSSSQITGSASAPGSTSYASSAAPAASRCTSLNVPGKGKSSPPVLLTPTSSPPVNSTSPPVSTPPDTTPPVTSTTPPVTSTTPPASATPDPGSASTPTPGSSSQAGSAARLDAVTSQGGDPRQADMVPTTTPSATPSPGCPTSPAKAKKNSASTVSGGLSAFGALEFRVTAKAARND